jgi:hypothetical protein
MKSEREKNDDACRMLDMARANAERMHRENMQELGKISKLNERIGNILCYGAFRHLERDGSPAGRAGKVADNFPYPCDEDGMEHECHAHYFPTSRANMDARSHGN